jgi:predicted metal-dependent enzyme (double-stranded beta helix superfamily)
MDDMADLAANQAHDLVAWADDLLRADGHSATTLEAIADALRQLGKELALRPETALSGLHGAAASATVLARAADGPVLMLARFPPEAPTPVHNHNSWGIVCVVRGRDRYLRWERLDDGSDPEHAQLTVSHESELGVGDVIFFDEPPRDIHSQQGIDGPAWELVLFGHDPDAAPRAYFDPDAGTVTYASSAR